MKSNTKNIFLLRFKPFSKFLFLNLQSSFPFPLSRSWFDPVDVPRTESSAAATAGCQNRTPTTRGIQNCFHHPCQSRSTQKPNINSKCSSSSSIFHCRWQKHTVTFTAEMKEYSKCSCGQLMLCYLYFLRLYLMAMSLWSYESRLLLYELSGPWGIHASGTTLKIFCVLASLSGNLQTFSKAYKITTIDFSFCLLKFPFSISLSACLCFVSF